MTGAEPRCVDEAATSSDPRGESPVASTKRLGIGPMRRFLQRDPLHYWDGINHYLYVGSNPSTKTDPHGQMGWNPIPMALCACAASPWQTKCTGLCAAFFAQPYPPGTPPPPGNCSYPNRLICWGLFCWQSQCVCQCAGDSPGMNCVRACIRCADNNGAPNNTTVAEDVCYANCNLAANEQARLNCCLNQDSNNGGCMGGYFPGATPPPMNPNPNNPQCTSLPIP